MTFLKSKMERVLFLFGAALLVVGLFYGLADWHGNSAWEKYKREWKAKGERFDLKDFVPKPVPDDQNFALTPVVASSYEQMLDKNGHVITPRHTNIVNRLEMKIPGGKYTDGYSTNIGNFVIGRMTGLKTLQNYFRNLNELTNVYSTVPLQSPAAGISLTLKKFQPDIEELRAASRLPLSRFPLNYDTERPFDILLPHLAALKACSQVLQLRAITELENGESEKGLEDVKLSLRLADSVRTEPFLITPLVRIAMFQITLQPVWEGFKNHRWSDAQLAELNQEFAKLDFLADYEFAIRGERASGIATIEYLRRVRDYRFLYMSDLTSTDDSHAGDSLGRIAGKIFFHSIPSSVFYNNELNYAKAIQQWCAPVVDVGQRTASPEAATNFTKAMDQMGEHFSLNNIFVRLLLPGVGSAAKKFAYAQSFADMARIACALERFRLANGNYPETLDALVPQFMEKIPHDVIGGKPLHYRRADGGKFILYSVGWNEADDGGTIVLLKSSRAVNRDEGDWVWKN